MKVLHTADWHLGYNLDNKSREAEFEKALDWILETARNNGAEALIIAGDLFDSQDPPISARQMYFTFLSNAIKADIRSIIIVAGNHDSPGMLDAPRELLSRLQVSVFGGIQENPEDCFVELKNADDSTAALVCCIPYPREKYIKPEYKLNETLEARIAAYGEAVAKYYNKVYEAAKARHPDVPLIATGHFHALDGGLAQMLQDEGSLYVIDIDGFPDFDYLALGHLHSSVTVKGRSNWRYPGSLLQMSFQKNPGKRSVFLLDTENLSCPQEIDIPDFQRLKILEGSREEILADIEALKGEGADIWLKVCNTGHFYPELQKELNTITAGTAIQVLEISQEEHSRSRGERQRPELKKCTVEEVFAMLLETQKDPPEAKEKLKQAFKEIADKVKLEG